LSPDPSGSPDYRAELALLVLDGDGVAKHAGRETALRASSFSGVS